MVINIRARTRTHTHTHTCQWAFLSIWFSRITHISGECLRDRGLQWALVMHFRVSVRCGMHCGTGIWCRMHRHASCNSSRERVILMLLTLLCVCGVYVRICQAATFLSQKTNIQFSQQILLYGILRTVMKTAFNNTWRICIITFCIMYQPRDRQPWLFIFVVFNGVSTNTQEYKNIKTFIFRKELYITILKQKQHQLQKRTLIINVIYKKTLRKITMLKH